MTEEDSIPCKLSNASYTPHWPVTLSDARAARQEFTSLWALGYDDQINGIGIAGAPEHREIVVYWREAVAAGAPIVWRGVPLVHKIMGRIEPQW